jgi:hypothetical protein
VIIVSSSIGVGGVSAMACSSCFDKISEGRRIRGSLKHGPKKWKPALGSNKNVDYDPMDKTRWN